MATQTEVAKTLLIDADGFRVIACQPIRYGIVVEGLAGELSAVPTEAQRSVQISMATKKDQIHIAALDILREFPQGIQHGELLKRVQSALPEINLNTIRGRLSGLDAQLPTHVYRVTRGVYRLIEYQKQDALPGDEPYVPNGERLREEDFYAPFADWLVNDLEECTKAISMGGNHFRDKWGTPDVIGVREPKKSDIIKFATEIVSVEIKLDPTSLITAFGQACAYRLFSHKAYLVVPRSAPPEDLGRLDTLARIFGIGLILFDATNSQEPNFDIRARAIRHEPDMFYVNRYMRLVEDKLFG